MRFELVRVALCALVLVILMAPVPSSGPGVAYAQGITRDYAENGTGPVISFSASDDEGTVLAWSLTGVDGGDFSIDGGKLNFRRPPDFEVPADADRDNVYAHIPHINPAGLAVISNGTTRCSRIAEHSGYHEC